jgi:hypothetical protein
VGGFIRGGRQQLFDFLEHTTKHKRNARSLKRKVVSFLLGEGPARSQNGRL